LKKLLPPPRKLNQVEQPIRFQGQYFDHESGLHYNRYRYYDPSIGRFVSQDPIGLTGGINNFIFGANSTGWIDPLGLIGIKLPKPPKGVGSTPKADRDATRLFTKRKITEVHKDQGGICPICEKPRNVDDMRGHHIERHADGGKTEDDNLAVICKDCHVELHR
jgi:RHS repeat-associated protein